MLRLLVPLLDAVVCTCASEPRSLAAGELEAAVFEAAAATGSGPAVLVASDPHDAVRLGRAQAGTGGAVLITGSLYLLEDLRDLLG